MKSSYGIHHTDETLPDEREFGDEPPLQPQKLELRHYVLGALGLGLLWLLGWAIQDSPPAEVAASRPSEQSQQVAGAAEPETKTPDVPYLQLPEATPEEAMKVLKREYDRPVADIDALKIAQHRKMWIVIHQLRAFGFDESRVHYLSQAIKIGGDGRPYVEYFMNEGHHGQIINTLLRLGVSLDYKVPTGDNNIVSMRELVQSLSVMYDSATLDVENSWIVDSLSYVYGPLDPLTSFMGNESNLYAYTNLLLERFNAEEGLACHRIHAIDTYSRIAARWDRLEDPRQSAYALAMGVALAKMSTVLESKIEGHANHIGGAIERFRESQTLDTAEWLRASFIYLGHALEALLDPDGMLINALDEDVVHMAADAFSRAVVLWNSDEYAESREKLREIEFYANPKNPVPIELASSGIMLEGDQMHGYAGLKRYVEWRDSQLK